LHALTSIDCADTLTCMAVGPSTVLTSRDGGTRWDQVRPPDVGQISSAFCLSARECFVVGRAGVAESANLGMTWHVAKTEQQSFSTIGCWSLSACIVAGPFGKPTALTISDDSLSLGPSFHSFGGVVSAISCSGHRCFLAAQTAAQGVLILQVTPGGRVISETRLPKWETIDDISCRPSPVCVAIGTFDGVSSSTLTAGQRSSLPVKLPATVPAALSCSGGYCYAINNGPASTRDAVFRIRVQVAKSAAEWKTLSVPLFGTKRVVNLSGIACPSATDCVVVGTEVSSTIPEGVIVATTDAGVTWTVVS